VNGSGLGTTTTVKSFTVKDPTQPRNGLDLDLEFQVIVHYENAPLRQSVI
jgi:hypothetical protein